jgi:hypothetical protein
MKTFSDLIFIPHRIAHTEGESGAEFATIGFGNGRAVSVIRGSKRFQAGPGTYEVAIWSNHRQEEVRGYQTAGDITAIMEELQA